MQTEIMPLSKRQQTENVCLHMYSQNGQATNLHFKQNLYPMSRLFGSVSGLEERLFVVLGQFPSVVQYCFGLSNSGFAGMSHNTQLMVWALIV